MYYRDHIDTTRTDSIVLTLLCSGVPYIAVSRDLTARQRRESENARAMFVRAEAGASAATADSDHGMVNS